MIKKTAHSKIYKSIVDILEVSPLQRAPLIEKVIATMKLPKKELDDKSAGSKQNMLRSYIGAAINEMHAIKLLSIDENGKYYLTSEKPVIIRIEKCESEILKALTEKNMTKFELRNRLKSVFGTDKTVTTRDDDILSTYTGQIIKNLIGAGVILLDGSEYKLSPRISARANDINAMLSLKSDFIAKIHSKGGEFFENYFMSLLKKYSEKHGKKVLESYVTGGADDGGIDGVMKTEDSLGFREITMVQTKNRVEISNETDVRGFYGAVCAKRGTRGIFATTSDFHPGAKKFLEGLDDCVGINGDKLFSMAIECSFGIKKHDGVLEIDAKIL